MKYAHILVVILLVLSIAACEEGSGVSEGLSDLWKDIWNDPGCEWGWSSVGGIMSTAYVPDPDTLEIRALKTDAIIRARLADDEVKVVDGEVASRLGNAIGEDPLGGWSHYDDVKYTLLHELELQVHEYLKGEGSDRITAIVAGQSVSDSRLEIECAKRKYEEEVRLEGGEGVYFLRATDVHDRYYLGLSDSITAKRPASWTPIMPGTDGEFYHRERREWVGLEEIRRRVSDTLQEYSRHDDTEWQECVIDKYYSKEWSKGRGMYMGFPIPLQMLPKQVLNFSGEHAPIAAGATIWEFPDGFEGRYSPRLEGESAEQFEITFHQSYNFTFNSKWEGTDVKGLNSVHSANWTAATENTTAESTSRQSGHILTTTEHLPQGLYSFSISWRDNEARDCGQDPAWTDEYLVVVTEQGGPSEPPPAPAAERWRIGESNSIELSWENLPGASRYVLSISRTGIHSFAAIAEIPAPEDDSPKVTWQLDTSTLPCDMNYYYVVQARGDGTTYIDDWGPPYKPLLITVTPENMPCKANKRRIDVQSGVLKPSR